MKKTIHIREPVLCALVMVLLLAAGCTGGRQEGMKPEAETMEATTSGNIVPEPIPAGFDFPALRATVQSWANANDTTSIRTHAWNIWAGMTTTSQHGSFNGQALPVWETWCGTEEVFGSTDCESLLAPSRNFVPPSQTSHSIPAEDPQVVSFNKFNPSMATFVLTEQSGPTKSGGTQNYDYSGQTAPDVNDLNNNWPAGTDISDRKINETPYTPPSTGVQGVAAMETKPVFLLVKGGTQLTPVPFWQGPTASIEPSVPVPATWTTCTLFDPSEPTWTSGFTLQNATQAQINNKVSDPSLSCKNYKYAPLGQIFHFELDADGAAAWNQVSAGAPPDTPQKLTAVAGDYAVLVAMHVNTKEILNWTWQTFWWQAGENAPNYDPGGVGSQTNNIEGVWTTYAMCAVYLQTQGTGSSAMNVCYNPYLETAFGVAGGLKSNCMSCHGQAIVGGSPNYPATYTSPIKFNSGSYYGSATTADFSWAIQGNQVPK